MYSENLTHDLGIFFRAVVTNQIARFSPKLYVKLTDQTGRGRDEREPLQTANYFLECFHDYRRQLGLSEGEMENYLRGKWILEYGPGDILGVAILFYAYGAQNVHCVDRFPLAKLTEKNIQVYLCLCDQLQGARRKRAESVFKTHGVPESGFNQNMISYSVTKNGLSRRDRQYDMIVSRAVLEHVNDLKETFVDIKKSLKPEGVSIHKVDLKSHGLDRYTEFDFLTWPKSIYWLMYGFKGFPNRWRINTYREAARECRLKIKRCIPTDKADQAGLKKISPFLATEFRDLTPEELSWRSFWIHLAHM